MQVFTAIFRARHTWAEKDIEADTPVNALLKARALSEDELEELGWEPYEMENEPLESITIGKDSDVPATIWQSRDLRLQLEAHVLFLLQGKLIGILSTKSLSDAERIWLELARAAIIRLKPPANDDDPS